MKEVKLATPKRYSHYVLQVAAHALSADWTFPGTIQYEVQAVRDATQPKTIASRVCRAAISQGPYKVPMLDGVSLT